MEFSKPDTIAAERGRYHLYISHACPYSARAVLARCVKQLTDVVSMSSLDPVRGPDGWVFADGEYADPLNGFRALREAYEATDASYEGRVSVPVLWDRKTRRIVSSESGDIMRMFGSAWDTVGGAANVTLYPERLRAEIQRLKSERTDTRRKVDALLRDFESLELHVEGAEQ